MQNFSFRRFVQTQSCLSESRTPGSGSFQPSKGLRTQRASVNRRRSASNRHAGNSNQSRYIAHFSNVPRRSRDPLNEHCHPLFALNCSFPPFKQTNVYFTSLTDRSVRRSCNQRKLVQFRLGRLLKILRNLEESTDKSQNRRSRLGNSALQFAFTPRSSGYRVVP